MGIRKSHSQLVRYKWAWQTDGLKVKGHKRAALVRSKVDSHLLKKMSRRFRKAYQLARACAKGKPPFPKERIFLCNWYVKLVKPGKEIPNNQVQCHVPMK